MSNNVRPLGLSRRERQIMDILYRLEAATAQDVRSEMSDAPGYSAVRALLRILVEKGHATYTKSGPRYLYSPTVPKKKAETRAVRHLMKTFFDDSVEQAVAALLGDAKLDEEELDRLSRLIEEARNSR